MDEIDVNDSILCDNSSVIYENPESQWWKRIEPSQRMHSAVDFDPGQLYRGESVESIVIERRERVIVKKKVRYSIADDFTFSDVESFRGDEPSMSFRDPPLRAIRPNRRRAPTEFVQPSPRRHSDRRRSKSRHSDSKLSVMSEMSAGRSFGEESPQFLKPKMTKTDSAPFERAALFKRRRLQDDAGFDAAASREASLIHPSETESTERAPSPIRHSFKVKLGEEDDAVFDAAVIYEASVRDRSKAETADRTLSLKEGPDNVKPNEEDDAVSRSAASHNVSGRRNSSNAESVKRAPSLKKDPLKFKSVEGADATFEAATSFESSGRKHLQGRSEADSVEMALSPKRGLFKMKPNEEDFAVFDAAISCEASRRDFVQDRSEADSIERVIRPKKGPFNYQPNEKDDAAFDAAISYDVSCGKFIREPSKTDTVESALNIKPNEEDAKIFSQPTSTEEDKSFHRPNRPSIRLDHEKSVKKRRTEDETMRLSPLSCSSVTFTNLPSSTFIEEQMTPRARRNLRRLSNKENFQDHIPPKSTENEFIPIQNEETDTKIISKQRSSRISNVKKTPICIAVLKSSQIEENTNLHNSFTLEAVRKMKSIEVPIIMEQFPHSKTAYEATLQCEIMENTNNSKNSLNQSAIDRALEEEFKSKRTNPPVRHSILPKINIPLEQDIEISSKEESKVLYPSRFSNIPVAIHGSEESNFGDIGTKQKQKYSKNNVSNIAQDKNDCVVQEINIIDIDKNEIILKNQYLPKILDTSTNGILPCVNISGSSHPDSEHKNASYFEEVNSQKAIYIEENSSNKNLKCDNLPILHSEFLNASHMQNINNSALDENNEVTNMNQTRTNIISNNVFNSSSGALTNLASENTGSQLNSCIDRHNVNLEKDFHKEGELVNENIHNASHVPYITEGVDEKYEKIHKNQSLNNVLSHKNAMNSSFGAFTNQASETAVSHLNTSLNQKNVILENNSQKEEEFVHENILNPSRVQNISKDVLDENTEMSYVKKSLTNAINNNTLLNSSIGAPSNQVNKSAGSRLDSPVKDHNSSLEKDFHDGEFSPTNADNITFEKVISENLSTTQKNVVNATHVQNITKDVVDENNEVIHMKLSLTKVKSNVLNNSFSAPSQKINESATSELNSSSNSCNMNLENFSHKKSEFIQENPINESHVQNITKDTEDHNDELIYKKQHLINAISNSNVLNRSCGAPSHEVNESTGLRMNSLANSHTVNLEKDYHRKRESVQNNSAKNNVISENISNNNLNDGNANNSCELIKSNSDTSECRNIDPNHSTSVALSMSSSLINKERSSDNSVGIKYFSQDIDQSTKSNLTSTWSESISLSIKENSLNHENTPTDECRQNFKITSVFDIFKRVDFTKLKIEDPCVIARGNKRLCEHNVIEKENKRELLEIAHNKSKLAEFLGKTTVTLNSLTKPTINKVKADKNVNLEQAMGGEKFILEYKKPKLYTKESWITKHLYKFIQNSLEERYGPKALMKSEKFIIYLAQVINEVISENNVQENVKELKETMAKLNIIHTNHDFYQFCREYTPFYFQNMVLPSCSRDNEDIQSINRYDPIIDGQ